MFVVLTSMMLSFLMPLQTVRGQEAEAGPEDLTLRGQYDALQRRTRIYEGFRAIREDMFQDIRRQSLDSLNQARQRISALEGELLEVNARLEQQAGQLEVTETERDQAIANKDSITFLGKPVKKGFYNVVVWSVMGILALLALVLLVVTRNARRLSRQRAIDLNDVLQEYENYRKTSRERLERITVEHFNEIKKLKGL